MPKKRPSPIAKLRETLVQEQARNLELETALAGERAKVSELTMALAASILNKAFETFNEKHAQRNAMPIKPRPIQKKPARSRIVQIRGMTVPAIIENYQGFPHNGMITFWGSNQSRITVRDDEIEFSGWLDEASVPALPALEPVPVISALPPAPSEEDDFAPREESKTYRGYDRDSF